MGEIDSEFLRLVMLSEQRTWRIFYFILRLEHHHNNLLMIGLEVPQNRLENGQEISSAKSDENVYM